MQIADSSSPSMERVLGLFTIRLFKMYVNVSQLSRRKVQKCPASHPQSHTYEMVVDSAIISIHLELLGNHSLKSDWRTVSASSLPLWSFRANISPTCHGNCEACSIDGKVSLCLKVWLCGVRFLSKLKILHITPSVEYFILSNWYVGALFIHSYIFLAKHPGLTLSSDHHIPNCLCIIKCQYFACTYPHIHSSCDASYFKASFWPVEVGFCVKLKVDLGLCCLNHNMCVDTGW